MTGPGPGGGAGEVWSREGSVPPGGGGDNPEGEGGAGADVEDAGDRWLLCVACGARVTTESARIEVDGAHVHHRVNPAAESFHLGCFCHAPGSGTVGEPTTFWTWFPPYAWLGAVCRGCDAHLGWRFDHGDDGFFGLILDRLRAGPPRSLD